MQPPDLDARPLASLVSVTRADSIVAHVLVDEIAAERASLSSRVRERSQPDLFGKVSLSVMVTDREVIVRVPHGSDWVLDRYATSGHVVNEDG